MCEEIIVFHLHKHPSKHESVFCYSRTEYLTRGTDKACLFHPFAHSTPLTGVYLAALR